MAPKTVKQKKSLFFPVTIGVIVVIMVGIIAATIFASNNEEKKASKQETSPSVSVSAATVNGQIGADSLSAFSDTGSDPDVGKIVPTITAQNFKGESVTIEPGKEPYALAFIAHWCPHCQKEVPKIVQMYNDGQVPKNVKIYAVATGTNKSATNYPPSKWLLSEKWPWPVVADTEDAKIAQAFGLQGYPYVVYVNADGTVNARTSGEQDTSAIQSNLDAISSSAK